MFNFLTELIKPIFIVIFISFAIFIFFLSFGIDTYLVFSGKDPYFFDPDKIESYDEPIFTNIDDQLIAHYEANKSEIHTVRRNLIYLPDNDRLTVEYKEGSEVSLFAKFKGGSRFSSHFDYKSEENQETLDKIGIKPDMLDRLKKQVERSGCFSFEKEKGIRLGFKKAKSGTFYFRFNSVYDPPNLQDSCLIMKLNDQIYLEYKGSGRGSDCVVNKNPEGFDDRSFLEKWFALIWNGKVVVE